MDELVAALIAGAIGIVAALASLVVSWIKSKRATLEAQTARAEIEDLRAKVDAAGGVYWVECPTCKTRIYLSGAAIHQDDKTEGEA